MSGYRKSILCNTYSRMLQVVRHYDTYLVPKKRRIKLVCLRAKLKQRIDGCGVPLKRICRDANVPIKSLTKFLATTGFEYGRFATGPWDRISYVCLHYRALVRLEEKFFADD